MTRKKQSVDGSASEISRRRFLGTAAAAAVGVAILPGCGRGSGGAPAVITSRNRPNSNFGGVQIGTISYSFRQMEDTSAEAILGYLVECGINSVELMGDPILAYAGAPATDAPGQNQINRIEDPAQREAAQRARDAFNEEMRRWRASPPMERFEALRRRYDDAGVTIHLAKFSPGADEEAADFAFRAARALGAKGVSNEIGDAAARVMGPAAARYGLTAALHNHGQPGQENFEGWDHFLNISPGVSLNLDVGHYYGYTGRSPIPTIQRYHQRITSFHMKDRSFSGTFGQAGGNHPWGEGGTPIADVLRLVQREGYPIHCDIELEYEIPEGSTPVAEVKKCVEFCRDVLIGGNGVA